jgi:hypothetical protein
MATARPGRYKPYMTKLVVLFRRPRQRPEQLVADVLGKLVPRCQSMPGLSRLEVASTHGGLDVGKGDRRGPPFLMVELYFPDQATLDAAMVSAEGRGVIDDLIRISEHEVNAFVAEVRPMSV